MTAVTEERPRTEALVPLPPPRRRISPTRVVVYLLLILGVIPTLLPLIWLVRSALMTNGQMFIGPPQWIPRPFAWSNFSGAMTAQPFGSYFSNTLIIEFFVLVGTLLSCSFAAFSFARLRWRGRNVVFGVLLSGVMLPYAVTLIPTFVLWRQFSALNTFFPLIVPAFFGSGPAIFNIFLLRQFFLTIPYELDEAAYIDGASPFGVFWRIILPLSKPAMIVVSLFTFLGVWNDYLNPLVYLNSQNKFTLALGLASFQGEYTAQWGYLMAASTIVIAPIVVLFFIGQRYFIEGVTLTGLKA